MSRWTRPCSTSGSKQATWKKHCLHPTNDGTPQGGIISPVLANLALDGLEKRLRERYPPATRKSRRAQVNLIRYADDFIITGRSCELLRDEVRPLAEQFLQERGLELSAEKTRLTHIAEGFDFLSDRISASIAAPCSSSRHARASRPCWKKIRQVIRVNRAHTAGELIFQLNPIIRGWANYHCHVVSKRTFTRVDAAIFGMVWHWARRRHRNKNWRWIKAKYFGTYGGDQWRLFGSVVRGGAVKTVYLYKASSVPVRRHVKIQMEANPYDPQWELYFEHRLGVQMASNLRHRWQLRYLWQRQNGICPVCGQKITRLTGWHNHHLVWRTLGGADSAENRVLLHPNCHRQVHNPCDTVGPPRLLRGVGKA